jgi:Outer membrane cobalamin receptor protein
MGQPYSYPAADSDEILTATRQNARENTGGLLKYRYGQDKKFTVESTVYLQDFDAHELPGIGGRPTIGDQRDKNSSDYSDQTYLLRSAASYRVSANNSIDFMAFGWGYQDSFYADFTELNNGVESFSNREESHYGVQVHQQLSLDGGSFDGVNHFAYGYEYLSINLDTYSNKMIAPDGSVVLDEPSLPESGYNRDLHSLVVDGRYELNRSGLQVAYGLRMDAYNDFDGELSPRLGFSQPLSDSQHVHITYSQAFRAPALFELYGTQRIEPNFELQPETLQSLDLKYSLERGSSLHQITLFNNKWNQGIQIILYDQPTEFALGQYQNTGRNEAYGAEYELKMRWQAWEVDWNTSYIRSKNIESEEVFSAFPHWISDLNLGYRFNNNWSAYCNNRYMLRDLVSADLPESGESVDYLRTDVVFPGLILMALKHG